MNLNTSCFIHNQIHFDKLVHINLCHHLHKVKATQDIVPHTILLMDQQMYLTNRIIHTFYQ